MQKPYWLYRLISVGKSQIVRVLPKRFWDRITIIENNEPMVSYQSQGTVFLIRKTIAEKLGQVTGQLPHGIFLKVLDGYRSLERQRQAWEAKWDIIKSENPHWTDERIESQVRLIIAQPIGITNHVCGGAVDVCLVNEHGEMLDFGTGYGPVNAHNDERARVSMFAKTITPNQKANRKILRDAMVSVGFVYYPGEWWHYCYNDRMWAVYTGRATCGYGPVLEYEK